MEILFLDEEEKKRVGEAWLKGKFVHVLFVHRGEQREEIARVFRAKHPHLGVAQSMQGYTVISGARLSSNDQALGTFSLDWFRRSLLQDVPLQERWCQETRQKLNALFGLTLSSDLPDSMQSQSVSRLVEYSLLSSPSPEQAPEEQPLSAAQ